MTRKDTEKLTNANTVASPNKDTIPYIRVPNKPMNPKKLIVIILFRISLSYLSRKLKLKKRDIFSNKCINHLFSAAVFFNNCLKYIKILYLLRYFDL